MKYKFTDTTHRSITREDDDGMRYVIPWNDKNNRPENLDTVAGAQWAADGYPTPEAYTGPLTKGPTDFIEGFTPPPPPPTPEPVPVFVPSKQPE